VVEPDPRSTTPVAASTVQPPRNTERP
jgi:hypothetical protein